MQAHMGSPVVWVICTISYIKLIFQTIIMNTSIDKTNVLLIQQPEFYPYFYFNNTNQMLSPKKCIKYTGDNIKTEG